MHHAEMLHDGITGSQLVVVDGAFGLETYKFRWTEEREWSCGSSKLLAGAREKKHCVSTLLVVDKVLPRVACLACLPLSFPMQQFSAQGSAYSWPVIAVLTARREL